MKNPSFSICIPCYNQAEYLPDAIESALSQTVKCEVIVVNDGSTDTTEDVAKQYPVKLVNQANKGLPSARNTGIMNAKGSYILPLDADDILMENCIEKMMPFAEQKIDVIAPSFKAFGVHNQEVILGGIPTLDMMKQANHLPYFSAVKRSVLNEVGGYNPKMLWGFEDWDLWIDIFKRGHTLGIIHEPLVLYRTKEQSMIHDANKYAGALQDQMKANHPKVYA